MADNTNKPKKEISFEMPIKSRYEEKEPQTQKISFSDNNKFEIGLSEDGSSLATVVYINGHPHLVLDPKVLDLNLSTERMVLKDGRQAYKLSNLEIDGENNIKITVTSILGTDFSNIQFLPNEVVVTTEENKTEKHNIPLLNLSMPKNLFELSQKEDNFVTVKNLPSQFMSVMKDLDNVTTMSLFHKGKKLTLARVGNKTNPTIYIVNGTRMSQHTLEDFYFYSPTEEARGFVGIKASKSATSAYGLKNMEKQNIEKIINFISNEESAQRLTRLTKEQLQEQILKAKTLTTGKEKSKYDVSFTKQTAQKTEEEKIEVSDEKTETQETGSDDIVGATSGSTEEEAQEQSGVVIEDETAKNNTDDEEKKIEPNTKKDDLNKTVETEANADTKDDNKNVSEIEKEGKGKPEPEEKTVNLSDLVKTLGVALFVFGLFTGFGGILLSILSLNIVASHKNFEKVKLPKGPKALPQAIKKAQEKGVIKTPNVNEKSTAKEENKTVEHLEKEGVINKELATEAKEIIKSFEKTAGLADNVEKFFKAQYTKTARAAKALEIEYNRAQADKDLPKLKKINEKYQASKKGLLEMEEIGRNFILRKNQYAEELTTHFEQLARYQELVKTLKEADKPALKQKKVELAKNLDALSLQIEDLESNSNLSEENQKLLKNIKSSYSIFEKEYLINDLALGKLPKIEDDIALLEKTVVNPQIAEDFKNLILQDTKKHFSEFYAKAKELEDTYLKFAKIDKDGENLAKQIENFDGPQL